MSPQAGYILNDQIAPRLGAAIPRSVLCVGSEDPEELVYDGICMAAKMIDRVEAQGKLGKVSPSNIAYYTIQHLKSGRRACGSSAVDIMGSQTQLNGSSRIHSMHEVVSESECGSEIFELGDVISQDREDPSTIAARKMDWQILMATLNTVEKRLIECLADGMGIRELCKTVKLNKAHINGVLRELAAKVTEIMGLDILKEIVASPQWRINLDAETERLACRHERRP